MSDIELVAEGFGLHKHPCFPTCNCLVADLTLQNVGGLDAKGVCGYSLPRAGA